MPISGVLKFSRSASKAASPTIGDVKTLNKTTLQVKQNPVTLRFWRLQGPLRLVGYPNASYRNNEDKSSQRAEVSFRAQVSFLAEPRDRNSKTGNSEGSLIDYESQQIKRTVLSTTASELYSFMKCFGTCQFLLGLWMAQGPRSRGPPGKSLKHSGTKKHARGRGSTSRRRRLRLV